MNLTPEQVEQGRRNFLKALAGTPALAALGVSAALKGPVPGGRVRVGFIGVGSQGRSLLGNVDPAYADVRAEIERMKRENDKLTDWYSLWNGPKNFRAWKLAFRLLAQLREDDPAPAMEEQAAAEGIAVLRPRPNARRFSIEREGDAYRVVGEEPVVLVEMLALQSDESRAEAMRRLRRMGVVGALKKAGVREGDAVRFGDVELRWE